MDKIDIVVIDPLTDIPRDKNYPADAVQCNFCGGHGCSACGKRGWLPAGDPNARRCVFCNCTLAPGHFAVYCTNECALKDA